MILFRFQEPQWLGLLLLVIAFSLVMWRQKRKAPRGFSWQRFILLNTAFTTAILGLARPQFGQNVTETRLAHSHIYLALDISKSMLAQDIPPSRMTFAISFVQRLLQQVPGVKVALFPFAANGFLLMPLTNDMDAAVNMLTSLNPGFTTHQGTNFTRALEKLFQTIAIFNRKVQASGDELFPSQVVLLSDGETHAPIESTVLQAYRAQHIPIHTVAVGTPTGGLIPLERRGTAEEMLKDGVGKSVRTSLVWENLKKISDATQGDTFNAKFEEVNRLARKLTQSAQMGKLSTSFRVDKEVFPICLCLAFILFALEFLRGRWQYALRSVAILLLLGGTSSRAEESDNNIEVDPEARAIQLYNEGVKAAAARNAAKAAELFQGSANLTEDPALKKKALFNLGNTLLRQTDPVQALDAYQQAADTTAPQNAFERDANKKISDNMALAVKLKEQMKQMPSDGNDGKEGQDQPNKGEGQDQKGPKKYKAQDFNDSQRRKIFDLVASEEQQTMQRIQDQKNKSGAGSANEKPW